MYSNAGFKICHTYPSVNAATDIVSSAVTRFDLRRHRSSACSYLDIFHMEIMKLVYIS